ncbi:MAG: endolytic transglycosylase MltG [Candidatus Gracilibacteria bacterium]|nr:endolytic transglycosylase MltG [Candidatus Gracilibacteria bacterium]
MGTEFRKKNINMINETENITKQKKPNNIVFRLFKLLIWIFIILIIYIYFGYSSFQNKIIVENDLILEVKTGDTFKNLGEKIEELNNMYYSYYIKNNKPDFELQIGTYKINAGSDIVQTIESLKTPITSEIKITILEGWNIYDIDFCLSSPEKTIKIEDGKEEGGCLYKIENNKKIFIKTPLINAGEYINYVTNPEKIKALSDFFAFIDNQITLEGFLYPDTYTIDSSSFKINTFVIKELETFETKVYNKILSDLDNKTVTELINLASIVEKEERNPTEKSTVAGILKKRLNSDWMIGADITVCYPHELTSQECKLVVSKYINEKSDYNTRTMTGLPKTPIGNPSYETIYATLNDKKTSYWFYLHDINTGKIYYAETNAEHESNKKYMY